MDSPGGWGDDSCSPWGRAVPWSSEDDAVKGRARCLWETQSRGGVPSTNTLASVAQCPSTGHEECGPSDLAVVFKIQEQKNKGRGAMPVASRLDILPRLLL